VFGLLLGKLIAWRITFTAINSHLALVDFHRSLRTFAPSHLRPFAPSHLRPELGPALYGTFSKSILSERRFQEPAIGW
jgi:hypothetical protein